MITVTKIFKFEACHHLPNYEGACHNLHGHSYKLEITVGSKMLEHGLSNPKQGMVIDFKDLKKIVNEVAVDKYDHSNLNEFFPNPTAEIMVRQIALDVKAKLPKDKQLVSCKLWETDTSYAEFNPLIDELNYRVETLERLLKYADNDTLKPAT